LERKKGFSCNLDLGVAVGKAVGCLEFRIRGSAYFDSGFPLRGLIASIVCLVAFQTGLEFSYIGRRGFTSEDIFLLGQVWTFGISYIFLSLETLQIHWAKKCQLKEMPCPESKI
jgi:hypothetical protein